MLTKRKKQEKWLTQTQFDALSSLEDGVEYHIADAKINYNTEVSNKPILKTDNTTAQTASASETISGTINLHKVSKTGSYNDLNNLPLMDYNKTSSVTLTQDETSYFANTIQGVSLNAKKLRVRLEIPADAPANGYFIIGSTNTQVGTSHYLNLFCFSSNSSSKRTYVADFDTNGGCWTVYGVDNNRNVSPYAQEMSYHEGNFQFFNIVCESGYNIPSGTTISWWAINE